MNTRTTPLIVFICLLFWGCENEAVITASAARLLYDSGHAVFLDVRTKTEYDDGHIESSVHIPVSELSLRYQELEDRKNDQIIVYCRSGNRSRKGTSILLEKGFNAKNMLGGFIEWNSSD